MNFKMVHTEVHVLDLDASLAFYKEALGLEPVREKGPEDGSWKIVFLKNDQTDFQLELTWNLGRAEPYDNGGGDIHLAFTVDACAPHPDGLRGEGQRAHGHLLYRGSGWILDRDHPRKAILRLPACRLSASATVL